jgi:hypothetical protein
MNSNDPVIEHPTFYQNIRLMFSQYDQIMMLSSGRRFDLFDYNSVKSMANQIYLAIQPNEDPNMAAAGWSKLQQVHIMPPVGGPWPKSWVHTFKNWIADGCPAGTDTSPAIPAVDPATLDAFIALSKALTGIDQFFRFDIFNPDVIKQQEQELATIYYYRLSKYPSTSPSDNLNGVIAAWNSNPDVAAISKSFPICKDIITIWYNTTTSFDGFGSPQFNQYKQGQVWKVSLSHPTGYAPENTPFYWTNAPSENGEFSGFYFVNY